MQQIARNIQCTNAPHSCAYTPGSQQGLQRQRMLRPAGLSVYLSDDSGVAKCTDRYIHLGTAWRHRLNQNQYLSQAVNRR